MKKYRVNYKVEKYTPGVPIWLETKFKYFNSKRKAEIFMISKRKIIEPKLTVLKELYEEIGGE